MTSNAQRIETFPAEYLDSTLYDDSRAGPLRLSRGAMLAPLSRAFDMAERRQPGHAQRVAYVSMYLANELDLDSTTVEAAFFAGLLHDIGMAGATTTAGTRRGQARRDPAQWAEVVRTLNLHCEIGGKLVRRLGLGEEVARAVAHHHDCWDGSGMPGGLSGERLPLLSRIVAVADRIESLIDQEASPLLVRRTAPQVIGGMAGAELDPELAGVMANLARDDGFWLGFYGDDLQSSLVALNYGGMVDGQALEELLGVVADLVDSRNGRTAGHARRVAVLAGETARLIGLTEPRIELIRLAAMLQDIGTLGVPVALLHKPDILSVDEMATMQLHPTYARDILSEIPHFGPAAWWVACHHERVDGKGYPGMLEGGEVPVEAQIIGACETFEALTNDRPYRKAMAQSEAMDIVNGLVGERFEADVVTCMQSVVA
jgi:putative nucleotidyltransferase with HDIG domain